MTKFSSEAMTFLNWTAPTFTDPVGKPIEISTNYPQNSYTFPWGDFDVQYVALKPSNGMRTSCVFSLKIRRKFFFNILLLFFRLNESINFSMHPHSMTINFLQPTLAKLLKTRVMEPRFAMDGRRTMGSFVQRSVDLNTAQTLHLAIFNGMCAEQEEGGRHNRLYQTAQVCSSLYKNSKICQLINTTLFYSFLKLNLRSLNDPFLYTFLEVLFHFRHVHNR